MLIDVGPTSELPQMWGSVNTSLQCVAHPSGPHHYMNTEDRARYPVLLSWFCKLQWPTTKLCKDTPYFKEGRVPDII